MSWLSKLFNREDEYEIVRKDIPMTTLMRWYLYDTGLGDPNTLADIIGLNKVSEEGDAKEQEESELRIAELSPLMPFLDAVSDMSVHTMLALQEHKMKKVGLEVDEEEEEAAAVIYKAVSMSTLIGALSMAIDLGLLETSIVSSGSMKLDLDDWKGMEDYE